MAVTKHVVPLSRVSEVRLYPHLTVVFCDMKAHGEKRGKIVVAIDIGSTKTSAAFSIVLPDGTEFLRHILRFPGADPGRKDSDELPAVAARSERGWEFGDFAKASADGVLFTDIKLSITRQLPAAVKKLQASFDEVYLRWGVSEDTTDLIKELFRFILKSVERRVLEDPECREALGSRPFEEVTKESRVTCPVAHSESLRLTLVDAARKAGFALVDITTEPSAAGTYVVCSGKIPENDANLVVVDCGGLTCDATSIHSEKHDDPRKGRITRICDPSGTLSGGQSINDLFIDWLKSHFPYLQAWSDWDEVSDKFELVKKSFSGQDRLIKIAGRQITIPAKEILGFFSPLVDKAVELALEQYFRAADAGHTPQYLVLCGGPCWNDQFRNMVFQRFDERLETEGCAEVQHVRVEETATITNGALSAALQPLRDPYVAGCNIAMTYLEDRKPSGRTLPRDRAEAALAWFIQEGQPLTSIPSIKLYKTVYPRGEPENRVIAAEIYRTLRGFKDEWIREQNPWNDLGCDITYPLTETIRSHVRLLGIVRADLPIGKIFPNGEEGAKAVDAHFMFSVTVPDQELKFSISYVEGKTLVHLVEKFVPAACFIGRSQWQLTGNPETSGDYEPISRAGGGAQSAPIGETLWPSKKRKHLDSPVGRGSSPAPTRDERQILPTDTTLSAAGSIGTLRQGAEVDPDPVRAGPMSITSLIQGCHPNSEDGSRPQGSDSSMGKLLQEITDKPRFLDAVTISHLRTRIGTEVISDSEKEKTINLLKRIQSNPNLYGLRGSEFNELIQALSTRVRSTDDTDDSSLTSPEVIEELASTLDVGLPPNNAALKFDEGRQPRVRICTKCGGTNHAGFRCDS